MTFNTGTATDYVDMLDQLVEVIIAFHVETLTFTATGTGYSVGEIINVGLNSIASHQGQVEVIAVDGGGAIDAFRIYRGGAYQSLSFNFVADAATTSLDFAGAAVAGGSGAVIELTFEKDGWQQLTRRVGASTAIVAAGGTGYSASEVLTLVGGVLTEGGTAATFTILSVDVDAVDSVTILSAGDYDVFPDNPVATTVVPSGGTGCTLTVATANIAGDTTLVLQGNGGSGLDPLVGIKAYSDLLEEGDTENVANWAIFGMTSWDETLELHDQANISPGFNTTLLDGSLTTLTATGSYAPLKQSDAFDMDWTIQATGRSVTLVIETESTIPTLNHTHVSFGLLNQVGMESEIAFPMYIAASSDRKQVWYKDATTSIFGGIVEVITLTDGPVYAYTSDDGWLACRVATIASATDLTPSYTPDSVAERCFVWPLGSGTAEHTTADDLIAISATAGGFDNDDLTLASATRIFLTPELSGDIPPLFPVILNQINGSTNRYRVFGEINGLRWFDRGDSLIVAFDRITIGATPTSGLDGREIYTVFRNGTQGDLWSYFGLTEG